MSRRPTSTSGEDSVLKLLAIPSMYLLWRQWQVRQHPEALLATE